MNDNGVSIELLKSWLKELEDAVYRMRVDQFIFRKVFDVIDNTEELQKRPSHFFAWIHDNYVAGSEGGASPSFFGPEA